MSHDQRDDRFCHEPTSSFLKSLIFLSLNVSSNRSLLTYDSRKTRVFEDFQELSVLSPRFSLMIQFDVDDFVSPSLLLRPSLSKLSFNEYTSKKYPNWSLAWGIFSSSWCSRMMTLWLLIQAKSCSASRTLQGILRLQVKYYSYLQRRDSGHQSDTHEIDWIDWTD